MFKKLMENKKASVAMVIALIVTVAVLVIGVYILYTFTGAIPSMPAGTANTTATNVINAGWNAFGLAVIIPIIVVAGAIIGYLVRGFQGGAR
jgi:hypothetical protein